MIKFLDLHKINLPYQAAFHQKLQATLDSGWFILGEEVELFEKRFAQFSGSDFGVGVSNGLDALVLIFKAYIQMGKLQKGDEVIVPANTYIASILAILEADLVPVLVEPNLETYNLDTALIESKISSKTKAILVVHLYGQLAAMEAVTAIGRQYNLLIVEDAAQGHGLPFYGNHTRAFSFYPGKNLGALGDAGAVLTNDEELANQIKVLRNYGSQKKYYNEILGFNTRLDALQAAFLNVRLDGLEEENARRRAIAKRYLSEIKNPKITLPLVPDMGKHVFHLFVIRTADRDLFQNYLKANGVETLIHYPVAPHQQKALHDWNSLSFPITEKIHREVLSLPMSPALSEDEVSKIIDCINAF